MKNVNNELTIKNHNGVYVADSLNVAEMVGKRHDNLIRDIQGYIDVLEMSSNLRASDFFLPSSYIDNLNREKPCYLLTRRGCDMVANKITGKKGVLFTATYVSRFEEMERVINRQLDSYMIADPIARAHRWIQEEEERLLLSEQNQIMLPKAETYDQFMQAPNCLDMTAVAQSLGMGRNKLYKFLRSKGIIKKLSTLPYQQYEDAGYFKVITTVNNGMSFTKTLVTPRGHEYIAKLLREEAA